jgi:alpha-galactosidase
MAESKKTVVLIGAGSASFTRGLLADMIVAGGAWDIRLVDIDPQALEVAFLLGQKMVAARNAPISLSKHLDRTQALPGAHFVVTTIAVGGRRAWEQDVFIPRKYGIYQPVGDTIMPGGISRALRHVPALCAIARDVEKLAPQARFFNYTNPMAMNCRGVLLATGVQMVGLCHGVKNGQRELAQLMGVEESRCAFTAVGMNHQAFFTEFTIDGKDARPALREKLLSAEARPEESLRRALFLQSGPYSVLNDCHLTEFFPQFHRTGEHAGGRLGVDIFSFEGNIANGDRGYRAMSDQAFGRAPLDESVLQRRPGEHEQLVSIFRSLDKRKPDRYSVILPNTGQVSNLPPGAPLECPADVSRAGVVPVRVGEVPAFLRAAVGKSLLTVELAAEAAVEQSKEKFLQAIIADGSAASMDDAVKLADELWTANAPYLQA